MTCKEDRFLSGWKEIATYLDKSTRTVQRYEHAMGLPVHRPAGKLQASVIASTSDIDAWLTHQSTKALVPSSEARELFSLKLIVMRDSLAAMRALRKTTAALLVDLRRERIQLVHSVALFIASTSPRASKLLDLERVRQLCKKAVLVEESKVGSLLIEFQAVIAEHAQPDVRHHNY